MISFRAVKLRGLAAGLSFFAEEVHRNADEAQEEDLRTSQILRRVVKHLAADATALLTRAIELEKGAK